MTIKFSKPAEKEAKKLPTVIKKKLRKQLTLLKEDPQYPSLQIKKMANQDCYEGRIDTKYRFRFDWKGDAIEILSVGMHDVGLGKK